MSNATVARALREMGDALGIEGADPFRVRAYHTAARSIASLGRSVAELAEAGGPAAIQAIPGVGKSIAAKVHELLATGSLAQLEELRRDVPPELSALLEIPGLGPKRLRMLHERCGVASVDDLERVLRDGTVLGIGGFGERSRDQLLEALARHRRSRELFRLADAEPYALAIVERLRDAPGVEQVAIAGSFRRRRETVRDLDVLCTTRRPKAAAGAFVSFPDVEQVLSHGPTRSTVRLVGGLQIDLRVVPAASFGAAMHYFTGSKDHNVAVRGIARRMGFKLNEYGAYRGKRRVAGRTEEEIFAVVGARFVPPELRENQGEIEAALAGSLPRLVELDDLRGDLHSHTTASDGREDALSMARAARELGREYLAITDHGSGGPVPRGLDAGALRARAAELRRLRVPGLEILVGVEVDILRDGSLALPPEALRDLDWVIGSVHGDLRQPRAETTRRVLRAIESGLLDVVAHPTSRLIPEREPIDVDLDAVIRCCAARSVALEINGRPKRLDLRDVAARRAKELGAKLVISSDAHSSGELAFLRYGVDVARRAWLERDDVLNALPADELRRWIREARRKRMGL